MAKSKTLYTCTECGGQSPKWQGQCPHCQVWNSLVETVIESSPSRFKPLNETQKPQRLSDVSQQSIERISSGMAELNRVLGGGFVRGGVILLGGDPGIGKSTLLLQTLTQVGLNGLQVLYVTGEESPEQVAGRAERLRLKTGEAEILSEIQLEKIIRVIEEGQPNLVVIDSIQTVYSEALNSAPGSVSQVRECAAQLTRVAKSLGVMMVMVGHVTKEGTIAGPRVLEHIVDTVLYFEGEGSSSFRLIRAIKNRFGAVNELGVFAMTETGLKEVTNPSALFLSHYDHPVPGSSITVTLEGTRPMAVEIQALVAESHQSVPRRLTVGLEQNRLAMLLAVLTRHAGIYCHNQDVFINAVAGVKITEPAADLAIVAAAVSSFRGVPLPPQWVIFGEIGLSGEIRPVQKGQERLKEAAKLGFTHALIPKANRAKQSIEGITLYTVDRVDEALTLLRDHAPSV
ncbi:DNA repair protein RadA [Ferrovum sp. PN-J185]|uniref:DNA repair protein RadA n=1 Tax=Ferrovum sp. PN-J185 TaxID=1356306 RepID=UPI000799A5F2|nr:DNA repair protein RadA [Ferrovum sp. PN-J185]KXW56961.1 hypothetical protein FV185_09260 [Ferrovum sp. PN-J185]MCC6069166.1 DNA repair protein RadA [Ferrovum sp. PN-J185]MDE1892382.1 DNA repair protein RadA [Betaproteobacteria bacterium]MDE2057123.1 DNA repair protein RadA [Betaproteobacteria bacterium]